MREGALRNFAKFTGKHLCQSVFLNKVAGLRPIKYEKIESRLTQLFCVFPLVVPSENSNKNTYHSSQI